MKLHSHQSQVALKEGQHQRRVDRKRSQTQHTPVSSTRRGRLGSWVALGRLVNAGEIAVCPRTQVCGVCRWMHRSERRGVSSRNTWTCGGNTIPTVNGYSNGMNLLFPVGIKPPPHKVGSVAKKSLHSIR